jgi:hypothetical protein
MKIVMILMRSRVSKIGRITKISARNVLKDKAKKP